MHVNVSTNNDSTSISSNSEDDEQLSSDSVSLEPPPKKSISSTANYRAKSKYRAKSGRQRKYNKKWEKDFPWLEYDENYQGAFCKFVVRGINILLRRQVEHGLRSPFGKKQLRRCVRMPRVMLTFDILKLKC